MHISGNKPAQYKGADGDGEAQIKITKAFIDVDDRLCLLDWGLKMRPHLNSNGLARQFRQTDSLPYRPPQYDEIRHRLECSLGLESPEREPMFGWYLSIIDSGGAVHSHMDPTRNGYRHLRCNIFLQMPEDGGLPIIEGEAQNVAEGDLLAFFPSEKRHRSQIVDGNRSRVIISFGYLVPIGFLLNVN